MKIKLLTGIFALIAAAIGIAFALSSENALVVNPKGVIAKHELHLMITNIIFMLAIILPTFVLLFVIVWKYCIKGKSNNYDPDHTFSPGAQLAMWILPSIIVAMMSLITWHATHKLNPYSPIEHDNKPLTIQVVALDWKWLFIYPEQGIATLNYFHIPEQTPVHLWLTADGAPMNSFWIPQLSGQIYSMSGMSTQLHIMADGLGEYAGKEVEINGEGYADMTFKVVSTTTKDFEDWVAQVKKSPLNLTKEAYLELLKPSVNKSRIEFTGVEDNLYHNIVHKYMYPAKPVL